VQPSTRWTLACYAYAALVVAAFGYFLVGVPIQVTDSFGNLVKASHGTLGSLVYGEFYQRAYLRPFLWGNLRVVYDLSGGHYFEWFRGWHVAQVALLALLFLRLVRPRTAAQAAAVPIGLAALLGIHTFAGTVREAFPINTFLTIVLCCFAAADLALGPTRWWRGLAAAVLFVFAALTVESGLLVGAVFVAAYIAGARGVSGRGITVLIAIGVGYLVLRFGILHVGAPGLVERSSGFGFSNRDPDELIRLFGRNPLPFYAYNVAASVLSVLFSEPRGGVWDTTRGFVTGDWRVSDAVNLLASTLATILIVRYAWRRRGEWLARRLDRDDQLVIVFALVTLVNAAISYAYTKDVIMSPAGAFLAVALTVAVAAFVAECAAAPRRRAAVGALVLLVVSSAWAFRAVGIHLGLRQSGATMRNEWAYVDQWLEREHQADLDADAQRLKQQLQDDATVWHPSRPMITGSWVRWFGD
jgi:hypothetical protein